MVSQSRLQKRAEWERRLDRHRSSGLTVARFCERERISVPSFYNWSRKLGSRGGSSAESESQQTPRDRSPRLPESNRGNTERVVSMRPPAAASRIHLCLNPGIRISLPIESIDLLPSLVNCLRERDGSGDSKSFQRVTISRR